MPKSNKKLSKESYLKVFLRFLRFGLLAWGGPVAQIDMIRRELVEQEKWISREHFNRILGTYQALPGPEAQELCVYFGMHTRGRLGGFLAGLGFMLPGFLLMLMLSWLYIKFGIVAPIFVALLYGFKPAVIALIVKAIHGIGKNAITNKYLFAIPIISAFLELIGVHFFLNLIAAGIIYMFLIKKNQISKILLSTVLLIVFFSLIFHYSERKGVSDSLDFKKPSDIQLFVSGLRTGLLTFGGAYTAIPFMQHDAVEIGKWINNNQFLDGLALSGILPAPFIIFTAFVGYLGGGVIGALLITLGVFLPAFAFTLLGYNYIEYISTNQHLLTFLDGLTAGVIGLIVVTAIRLIPPSITDFTTFAIFLLALTVLYKWKSKIATAVVVLGAGFVGLIINYTL